MQIMGEVDVAEAMYRQELAAAEAQGSAERRPALRMALAAHNLGSLLLERGELEEARTFIDRALELRRAYLPEGHARILASLNMLGLVYQRQGRAEESLPLFRELLEHSENALGARHERTLATRLNLAQGLYQLERWEEAEEESLAVLAALEDPVPGDRVAIGAHMLMARTRYLLGTLEEALAECDAAAALAAGPEDYHGKAIETLRERILARSREDEGLSQGE
jgi:tetratricopeptide (TPR) repeat protein